MATPVHQGTRDIPLRLAKRLTDVVQEKWASGELLSKVTPTTQDLLKYWFMEPHTTVRRENFHEGQMRSILNLIYLHEVQQIGTVTDIYAAVQESLLLEMPGALDKPKYEIPKYAIKMATGTGKTWVMHALLLWQYLNARHEEKPSGRYSKNFLLVAPGLIVYERLLDAYLGKENKRGERVFEKSDFFQFQHLLIPPPFRQEAFGFVRSSVVRKDEITTRVTGDGMIIITNWHIFMDKEKPEDAGSPLDNPTQIVQDLLPLTPGTSGGNDLKSLDAAYLRGGEIDFLAKLKDLVVINDEAHHIHENKSYGEVEEVEWQKSLNKIAEKKGKSFIQIDFSATPFDVTGSGQKRTRHYFPHVISDFDLVQAVKRGLVKTIAIDKRKEIVELKIDFKALRHGNNNVIGLSDGQKLMLRAGLKKLRILEEHFVDMAETKAVGSKYPKMLVMCEDTQVSPFVESFLRTEGMAAEDVLRVDSNQKGEIPDKEWAVLKERLFNIDGYPAPRVIVSVLMLREGFDVSNICVIVPLRAASADILLEQTVGRGLRLMWREPEFQEIKAENRKRLLEEKKEPSTYIDLLTIVEHPAFIEFYDDLMKSGAAGASSTDPGDRGEVLGDIENSTLKENFKEYDLFWPVIIAEAEEELQLSEIELEKLQPFDAFPLDRLRELVGKDGEKFFSEEMTVKTRFGEYTVSAALFNSQSYNEFLQQILTTVTNRMDRISQRKTKSFPVVQIHQEVIVRLIDRYVRERLFKGPFDPFEGNNWKLLLLKNGMISQHIVKEIGQALFEMQTSTPISKAQVARRYFSAVPNVPVRDQYSLELTKTIYSRTGFPSNKGEFEKNFMLFLDADSGVESFVKILEYRHDFAAITYIRSDGLLSTYHPDFLVKTASRMFVVETKAENMLNDQNVKQKQMAAVEWLRRVNLLPAEQREDREWAYVLLGDQHFYGLQRNGGSVEDILQLARLTEAGIRGELF